MSQNIMISLTKVLSESHMSTFEEDKTYQFPYISTLQIMQ